MKSGKAPFVTDDDLQLTMNLLRGKNARRNKAILLFSHFLGLRAKEMAALKIGDVIDVRNGKAKQVIRLLAAYTKGGKYREVFLMNDEAAEIVRDYIFVERQLIADVPLFLSQKGGAFSANTMQRMIGNLYKSAGVNASSHSGRR